MKKTRFLTLVFVLLGLFGVACSSGSEPSDGSGGSTGAAGSKGTAVEVVNVAYSPSSLEVAPGTEVVWTNQDDSVRHTVTSGVPGTDAVPGVSKGKPARADGAFDGDLADAGAEFTFTFDEPGTYEYFCRVHPSMTGEVVVR